jgi:hypothetical protein
VAKRTSAPAYLRYHALTTLLQFVTPSGPTDFVEIQAYGRSDTTKNYVHGGSTPGGRPLSVADRLRIIRTFADLSLQTSPPSVQHAARGALRASAKDLPQLTPVPAGTITLTYMCGNRFRIRNRSSVEGDFTYDVYGTPERGTVWVRASRSTSVASEILFQTRNKGTVRVFWQNQLLQTKANGGSTCTTPLPRW